MSSEATIEYPMEEAGSEAGEPRRGARSREAPLPLLSPLLSPTPPFHRGQGNRRRNRGCSRGPPRRGGPPKRGEDPHDMEEGGHHQRAEEGPMETSVPVQG